MPAFLMREDAFRGLFAAGRIKRIEFFGKLMEWHTRWTDNARTLYHVNYFRWGWLRRAREVASRMARKSDSASPSTDVATPPVEEGR